MLLAGGQGSRLYELTKETAKPAVCFGGKYKIIDFPLSNCINSGIDTVGVLTQYQPLALNEYIGNGAPWDLDRFRGGVTVLPPYQGNGKADWYKGTANAIYQNLDFIRQYDPEVVLILSGDHIYRMDYSDMIFCHKDSGAVCTVATISVPVEEASRFGICNTLESGEIYEFEEKPKAPKSNQASMGIYVFNTDTLIKYLEIDEKDNNSENDFGKNIIPMLISNHEKVFAYKFSGYWKDVGTIASLWESNMDLISDKAKINLADKNNRIFSRNIARPPQYLGKNSLVINSLISEGCKIYGRVENSVLSGGVVVCEGATVCDSVIMEDVIIKKNAVIYTAIIDSGAVIGENSVIGSKDGGKEKVVVIEKGSKIFNASGKGGE